MRKDKLKLYLFEMILVLMLSVSLFSDRLLNNKISISIFLLFYAVLVRINVKSSKNISVHSKEVEKYMIVFAVLYLILYYLIGYYVGYYVATYKFNFWVLYTQILPIIIIIYSSEVLRREIISDKSKISYIMTFIIGVLVDLIVYTNISSLSGLSGFLEAMGYVLLASIASNLLFNYIAKNFGVKPNIFYRLITNLYLYIIPITPDVHIYFKTFARIVYPILILLVIFDSYEKKSSILVIKNKKIENTITVMMIIFIAIFTMLISCKFKYGLIVIGSNSMINVLDKGDAVIYDSDYKEIKEGQIILFKKDELTIVHRVVRIDNSNGEIRIYTKGDSNSNEDDGYRTYKDVKGIVSFRIKKIGLPTIWVNEFFSR